MQPFKISIVFDGKNIKKEVTGHPYNLISALELEKAEIVAKVIENNRKEENDT